MKIIHVISTLNIGGAENFVMQLANQQVEDQEVSIVVTGVSDISKNYFSRINKEITVYPLHWKKKYSFKQFLQLYKLINKLHPDYLYVHLHNPLYYVYGISILKPGIKYTHTIHSSFENWKSTLSLLNKLRFLNNRILHVCVAESIYNKLKVNFPKLKSTVINNGIKSYHLQREINQVQMFWNRFSIKPAKGKRFLAIGNINRHKNFKMLAMSFTQIHSKHPDAMCIHIGNEMDEELSKELKSINAPNLFLAGPHNNAADFLSEADALIISSVQEGMPIVVLEALSMGVPVISTPAGGIKDIISNGINGLLIKDFQVSSLTNAITEFMKLPEEEKRRLRINARSCFEKYYDISKISKIYQNKSA